MFNAKPCYYSGGLEDEAPMGSSKHRALIDEDPFPTDWAKVNRFDATQTRQNFKDYNFKE